MAIFKNYVEDKFVKIPNELITDLRMSAPEFRLYCYLCSRPGTWKINNKDICNKLGIKSNHTLSRYWKVLNENNLISRTESKRSGGKFKGYDYELLPYVNQPMSVDTVTVPNHNGLNDIHSNTNKSSKKEKSSNTDLKLPETKVSSFTQIVIDVYYKWFEDTNGVPPKVDGMQAKGAKTLGEYLSKIVQNKNPDISSDEIGQKVSQTLEYIFLNWNKLDDFNQKQTKLSQINSNITTIISDLKRSSKKEYVTGRQTHEDQEKTKVNLLKAFTNE